MNQPPDPVQDAQGRPRAPREPAGSRGAPPRGAGPEALWSRAITGIGFTPPLGNPVTQRPVGPSRSARSFEQVRAAAENARRGGRSGPFSDPPPAAVVDGVDGAAAVVDGTAVGVAGVAGVAGEVGGRHPGVPSAGGPTGWTPAPPDTDPPSGTAPDEPAGIPAVAVGPADVLAGSTAALDPDLAAIGYIGGGGLTDALVAANRGGYVGPARGTHAVPSGHGAHVAELDAGRAGPARQQAGRTAPALPAAPGSVPGAQAPWGDGQAALGPTGTAAGNETASANGTALHGGAAPGGLGVGGFVLNDVAPHGYPVNGPDPGAAVVHVAPGRTVPEHAAPGDAEQSRPTPAAAPVHGMPPGDPAAGAPAGTGTAGAAGMAQASAKPPERGGPTDPGHDDRGARRGQGSMGPAGARALGNKVVGPGTGPVPTRGERGRPTVGRRFGGRREEPGTDDEPGSDEIADARPAPAPGPPAGAPQGPPGPHGTQVVGSGTGSIPAWLVEVDAATREQVSGTAAFTDPHGDTASTRLVQPLRDDEHVYADGPAPSLVRPYSRTGGRTKPGHALDLEALVVTTVNGREAWSSPLLTPEHVQVIGLCVDTTSVAEIAARLTVPIGVARVIIADMVDLGLVEVMKTSANLGDERDPAFLRRVLSGLQRL